MKNAEEIFEILKQQFGESIIGLDKDTPTEPIINVAPLQIHKIAAFLRETEGLKFDSLMCLSGVDDANGTKVKDADGFDTINGGTLSVYYHLDSVELRH
ncbi:MAG: NADH-quinone oxidoreductase subunit C, partial [Ignavibacteria bacterium]|nr:NADH-quinone oxidoreductase subunit C [Ignavibacteria bacterium]